MGQRRKSIAAANLSPRSKALYTSIAKALSAKSDSGDNRNGSPDRRDKPVTGAAKKYFPPHKTIGQTNARSPKTTKINCRSQEQSNDPRRETATAAGSIAFTQQRTAFTGATTASALGRAVPNITTLLAQLYSPPTCLIASRAGGKFYGIRIGL